MKIINLTPHSITFVDDAGNTVLTVEPSGQVARCSVAREKIGMINGIPINKSRFVYNSPLFYKFNIIVHNCEQKINSFIKNIYQI